jgi:hypothetical protein
MAVGNEWINGYLEAILASGPGGDPRMQPDASAGPLGGFNPTKYFVEEVVTSVDESDLHRTWVKVVATRDARERSGRLENMCWRIWHLTRKKKQVMFCFELNLVFSCNSNFEKFKDVVVSENILLMLSRCFS